MNLTHFQRLTSCYLTLEDLPKEERLWFFEGIIEKYCLICGDFKKNCNCKGEIIET